MSKQIENPKKQALLFLVTTFIICLIIWPLLDLLVCAIFTHAEFHYTVSDYVVEPAIFTFVITLVLYIPQFFKSRKKK